MIQIVPTVTATDETVYTEQLKNIRFADQIHIDLMDGDFAPTISPPLKSIYWPDDQRADIHLMYKRPEEYIDRLLAMGPNIVIIHAEAEVRHMYFAARMHEYGIKAGLAILQDTEVKSIENIINSFDQILIFSGHLGYHGGRADLKLLDKVNEIKRHHPGVELAWDGGINGENIKQLIDHGISILNVGGYIQNSSNAEEAYAKLKNEVA